jgi:hypothetical protein
MGMSLCMCTLLYSSSLLLDSCARTHNHIHTYIHIRLRIRYTYTRIRTYIHVYIHTYIHIHIYAYVYDIRIHVYIRYTYTRIAYVYDIRIHVYVYIRHSQVRTLPKTKFPLGCSSSCSPLGVDVVGECQSRDQENAARKRRVFCDFQTPTTARGGGLNGVICTRAERVSLFS